MRRRQFIGTLAAAAGASIIEVGQQSAFANTDWTGDTLDAFADTIIPGVKRYGGDVAVAGAAAGPSGAATGYLTLLSAPQTGLGPLLDGIAALLNTRSSAYAVLHGILLPPWRPPFVGLGFNHRCTVVSDLYQPDDPDRDLWAMMALLAGLAFDCAAHLNTATAVSQSHPGLAWLGFPAPGADGLWRFPDFSYGLVLAGTHPGTTSDGQPA
ncbi:DUF5987 family protein [Kribbella sp. NPDC004536]|uniref:DUF5987 family protein n=1 Tax=Kribbella sp. NPDC004536 TaxID=3364106 RepID=UPI00368A5377